MESLNLTPAESLMIISPECNGNELIKLTLIDLLLRKALKVNLENNSEFLNKEKSIIMSKNESINLIFKPHEELLMKIVGNNELELNEFAKILFKQISPLEYKNMNIREPLIAKGYFRRQRKMLLALVPYNAYVLTDEGNQVKSAILKLLNEAGLLKRWIMEDLGHAKAYLSVLGSHILLLNIYDIEDIKKFNKMLSFIKPESKTSDYYNYYLYTVPTEYMDDDDNLKSFDFLDISLLDNFDSFDEFSFEIDSESSSNDYEGNFSD